MDPWTRGREVALGVLLSSPKPEKKFFLAIGEGSRNVAACFLHSSAQMYLYQTPGRRPPPITGRFVITVTTAWSEPLTSAPRSEFMAQSLVFVDRCLSRTRNLAASNEHLAEFCSGRSWPKRSVHRSFSCFFFGVFEKFETFFSKICAHSDLYTNILKGIFEIRTFFCQHRVSIVTGLHRWNEINASIILVRIYVY